MHKQRLELALDVVCEDENEGDLLHAAVGEVAAVDELLVVVEEGVDEEGTEL